LSMHDLVREIIHESLKQQSPDRHFAYHSAASSFFRARLSNERSHASSTRDLLEAIYHAFHADQASGIREFLSACDSCAATFRIPTLQALVSDAVTYSVDVPSTLIVWTQYYSAWLLLYEGKRSQAEAILREVYQGGGVPATLRAKVLLELGAIATQWDRLGQTGGVENAVALLGEEEPHDEDEQSSSQHFLRARIKEYSGDWDGAVYHIRNAQRIVEDRQDWLGRVRSFDALQAAYVLQGRWENARTAKLNALAAIPQGIEFAYVRAKSSGYWAWASAFDGNARSAEGEVREALATVRTCQVTGSLPAYLRNLGILLGVQREFADAFAVLNEALQLTEGMQDPTEESLATTLGVLGFVGILGGRYDEATGWLRRSTELKEKVRDNLGMAEIHLWNGMLAEKKGELENAVSFYKRSLDWRWMGRLHCEACSFVGLARCLLKLNRADEASQAVFGGESLAKQEGYRDCLTALSVLREEMKGNIPSVAEE
jgi:tetratricopeptide (TPR) repeat protein